MEARGLQMSIKSKLLSTVVLAGVTLGAGNAMAACDTSMSDFDAKLRENPNSQVAITAEARREMRALRDSAIRLKEQGYDEACQNVMNAITDDQMFASGLPGGREGDKLAASAKPTVRVDTEQERREQSKEMTKDFKVTAKETMSSDNKKPVVDVQTEQQRRAASEVPEYKIWIKDQQALAQKSTPISKSASNMRIRDLIGSDVRNLKGETTGEVTDVVFSDNFKADYVVVSYGGFFGLGDKQVAVPISEVRTGEDGGVVYVDKSIKEFDKAPKYKDDMNASNDKDWEKRNKDFWSS